MAADGEDHGLGPAYSIHADALREWHALTIQCFACRRLVKMTPERFSAVVLARCGRGYVPRRLVDLEARLRCSECGNRDMNTLKVWRIAR